MTQKRGTVNDHPIETFFNGIWSIENVDLAAMAVGSQFYVVIDPAQIQACQNPLFKDGFEAF